MKIIFIRHGHPDYKMDCLTELGHRQAEAAARRLSGENIENIYASSCGRAYETAEHIARPLRLTVEKCDFMREINWGSMDDDPIPLNGHPWYTVDDMVAKGQSVMDEGWTDHEPFCKNKVIHRVQKVAEDFDQWLAMLGYEREGEYYRIRKGSNKTVAMVSHGGSSSAAISRLFNIPFPFVCATIRPDFTAISVVSFDGEDGALISPHINLLNDTKHIADVQGETTFDR